MPGLLDSFRCCLPISSGIADSTTCLKLGLPVTCLISSHVRSIVLGDSSWGSKLRGCVVLGKSLKVQECSLMPAHEGRVSQCMGKVHLEPDICTCDQVSVTCKDSIESFYYVWSGSVKVGSFNWERSSCVTQVMTKKHLLPMWDFFFKIIICLQGNLLLLFWCCSGWHQPSTLCLSYVPNPNKLHLLLDELHSGWVTILVERTESHFG